MKKALLCIILTVICLDLNAQNGKIIAVKQQNPSTVELSLGNNKKMIIDFYSEDIFRIFQDNFGGPVRDPDSKPIAKILVEQPRKAVSALVLQDEKDQISIASKKIKLIIGKSDTLFKVINLANNQILLASIAPVLFEKDKVTLKLQENAGEYFYGGGVQNGRFSHKGKVISIENQNSWTDGGVASPTPFYWSTKGYGILWHTFKKGKYDFGAKEKGLVQLSHETDYLDIFVMAGDGPVALLNQFYQLTGNPVLLPKFGFYQGHLNAYNRDYWKRDEKGILFEDGQRYKESQKDIGGIKESLNGEKDNYQFSARAVIDRYKKHDMPFGWILPNDGYGAGYGQTESLDGNVQNLKHLGDYARKNGVEIGLWTQSDLHPKPGIGALLQRDIIKEVKEAGVRVLKTDVAWVGAGYSFGLNGVADVAQITAKYGNNSRPFIISLDGWAGTQRYAGIWSGDQTGGSWEYIRFHIPTYLGSGLSGQPNISSDVDGIFGGNHLPVNTRDFQWKTFTPLQLNMDGWGSNEKYPHALGEPITSINRNYLKLKSELMPYAYSLAKTAITGLPMVRAMFLEYPNAYTLGKSTQYQFLYGPNFLVAPIYQATRSDAQGNDIRNGIYLPEGTWIDYFTGDRFEGNVILNSFNAPLWKLPVFVKSGSIIPLTNPNNNVSEIMNNHRIYEIYPDGMSSFTEYDDDGRTEQYKEGQGVSTLIEAQVNQKRRALIKIHPSVGDFDGFVKDKSTEFRINVTEKPKQVTALISGSKIRLTEVFSSEELKNRTQVFFYDPAPNLNRFSTKGSPFERQEIIKNPMLVVKIGSTDISQNALELRIDGFKFEPTDRLRSRSGSLIVPVNARISNDNREAYTLRPSWKHVEQADFYEIDFNGMRYTNIRDTSLLFDGLAAETDYAFKLRAVNKTGASEWTQIEAMTKSNPLEFAITGITAKSTVLSQGGSGTDQLFDFDESNLWHTKWGAKAIPFDLVMDMKTINQLDKFQYLPRIGKGNGVLLKGKVFYSNDRENWTVAGDFEWANTDEIKSFNFKSRPTARFVKISVTSGAGDYGSGRELYIFKVPGTESYLPGDINNDKRIDRNDLVSYTNYTGLRKGDADFEGYISKGDINENGLIDAYDISVVATQLEGEISNKKTGRAALKPGVKVGGHVQLSADKLHYNADEIIILRIKGVNLNTVNALSFALPYVSDAYEFISIQALNMKQMENLSYDRLHTNGKKALYPTFVNLGQKESLTGSEDLMLIKFRAKRKLKFDLSLQDVLLLNSELQVAK